MREITKNNSNPLIKKLITNQKNLRSFMNDVTLLEKRNMVL